MLVKTEKYSFWAVPETKSERHLGSVSGNLCNIVGNEGFIAGFVPHVTLFGDMDYPVKHRETLLAFGKKLPFVFTKFSAKISTVNFSDDYFKRVFLSFEPNEGLTQIVNFLIERLHKFNPNFSFSPDSPIHLSLLYGDGEMSEEQKADIRNYLESKDFIDKLNLHGSNLLGKEVNFNTIELVHPKNNNWKAVRQ
jgi:hypothetical protein